MSADAGLPSRQQRAERVAGPTRTPRPSAPSPLTPRPAPRRPAARPTPAPSGGPLGDSRGLTAAGGAILVSICALLGAIIDLSTGSGLRVAFAVLFVGSSALAAARVHREDLLASMIVPPLVYLAVTVIGAYAQPPSGGVTQGMKQNAIDIGTSLVLTAPVLLVGTGAAAIVALRRGRQYARRR